MGVQQFIKQHKGASFLAIGWLMGLATVGTTIYQTDKTITRLETQLDRSIETNYEYTVRSKETISQLREENRKLKSKTSRVKIVKPDGTIEEREVSETESEETVSESIKREYELRLAQELYQKEREVSKRIEEEIKQSKNFIVSMGYNSKGLVYGSISYTVLPPIVLNGYGTASGELGIGIGIRL